jgi:hypothetical protein
MAGVYTTVYTLLPPVLEAVKHQKREVVPGIEPGLPEGPN